MKNLKDAYKKIESDHFPDTITMTFGDQELRFNKRTWAIKGEEGTVEQGLRYGENPGQEAALYELTGGNLQLGDCHFIDSKRGLVSAITEEDMVQFGKHPGKTNLTDIDSALNILKYLTSGPAAVVVKHNNPSGVAIDDTIAGAFHKAFRADRIAAFGGCVALNQTVTKETAELIAKEYVEVVAAPEYEPSAIELLRGRKNLRIIRIDRIRELEKYRDLRFVDIKSLIDGGLILQQSPLNRIYSKDDFLPAESEYKGKMYRIERTPTEQEYSDMLFGWSVEQGVTSNSVLYVKNGVTVGIGTGEQDRVGVAEIAIHKAYTKYADLICWDLHQVPYKVLELQAEKGETDPALVRAIDEETTAAKGGLAGAIAVSDAFFPFRDGVDVIIRQGITAIVQPGGSIRDFESIQACNEADPQVTMTFTGQRAFRH